MNNKFEEIVSALAAAGSVAVFAHVRPDGDTLGSSLGLTAALRKQGKKIDVYCDDALPSKFSFLAGFSAINQPELSSYDLLIAVDCSDELRLGGYASAFRRANNTAVVDHHRSNTGFAKYNFVDPEASSTAEIALRIVKKLGVEPDTEIASCLFTGLSTDTGNFCHSNTTPAAFYAAYELAGWGVDVRGIADRLYRNSPRERIQLLGRTLTGMRFFEEGKVAVLTVLKSDLAACKAEPSSTEGFIDYGIGITGVEVAVCLLQHDERSFKVSFRSKRANVCAVASVFGGGGHTLASGCQLHGDYYDVLDKLMKAVRDELPQ